MTETIQHPHDKNLLLEVVYHPAEKRTGECGYSLGSPSTPAWYEITAVAYKDGLGCVDITQFVNDHCDNLFKQWEEILNQDA